VSEHLFTGRLDPLGPLRLLRFCRDEKVDVIYTFQHPLTMFWGGLVAKLIDVPIIVAVHATGGDDTAKRRLVTRLIRFDSVLSLAEAHKRYLVDVEKFLDDRVSVVRSGIDPLRYLGDKIPNASLGLPSGVPLVGIVAMLRPEKAHDVFIAAARQLCESTDAHFVIVGDGPERARVEQFCRDTGYVDRFHILGRRDDVPKILRAIDVAVLSSHDVVETLPIALMEAMAAGLPVVATRVGSIHELVLDQQTGLLVPPNDPAAMATAIAEILSDPEKASAFGEAGRRRIREHFTLDHMVRQTEKTIDRLISSQVA
jgi:glycosyltransferase involved in cell wall biosynthesis